MGQRLEHRHPRMSYRDRNRKSITLPTGATIVIAKLNTFNEPFLVSRKGDDDLASGVRLAKFALTNPNNSVMAFQTGTEIERLRIVDKPTAGDGEITIAELDQQDADTIVREVIEFSGLGTAGREARKTFPEGQATGGEPPSAGHDLPRAADRPIETAIG